MKVDPVTMVCGVPDDARADHAEARIATLEAELARIRPVYEAASVLYDVHEREAIGEGRDNVRGPEWDAMSNMFDALEAAREAR